MGIARNGRRRWLPMATATALVVAGTAAVSGTAFGAGPSVRAAAVPAGTYTLSVTKSGMCMDVTGASTASGALIQQWGCGSGQKNQEWTLAANGSGQYTIQSVVSGLCLDVPGASTASGVQLQQYACGAGKTNQLWTLSAVGSTYQIVNVNSGLCVSDSGASTTAGTAIIQETCTTNTNKTWTLTPVGSTPPPGTTITVAADGSGDVTTVQAAIDKVPANNATPVTVAIKKGTYREIVTVPATKAHVTLEGLGSSPSDVVIVDNHSSAGGYGTFGSATAFLNGHDFTATNLTFDNDYDYAAHPSQAVAVNLTADRAVFSNVRFLGHQDTLLVNSGARSYFRSSYVEGVVDFIFGDGIAVFDSCQIHQLGTGGNITAARTPSTSSYGYLIYKSNVYGDSTSGTGSLGRPWGQAAQVLYRESTIGSFLKTSQPWTDMSSNTWQAARFAEYKNTGAGASVNSNRPQLTDAQAANYTPAKYLAGSDGWNPTTS